jgi:hypothetical protein
LLGEFIIAHEEKSHNNAVNGVNLTRWVCVIFLFVEQENYRKKAFQAPLWVKNQ